MSGRLSALDASLRFGAAMILRGRHPNPPPRVQDLNFVKQHFSDDFHDRIEPATLTHDLESYTTELKFK